MAPAARAVHRLWRLPWCVLHLLHLHRSKPLRGALKQSAGAHWSARLRLRDKFLLCPRLLPRVQCHLQCCRESTPEHQQCCSDAVHAAAAPQIAPLSAATALQQPSCWLRGRCLLQHQRAAAALAALAALAAFVATAATAAPAAVGAAPPCHVGPPPCGSSGAPPQSQRSSWTWTGLRA